MRGGDGWKQARRAWHRLAVGARGSIEDDDGLAALSDIGVVRRLLDQAELAAVRAARRHGKSWAEIATHLGITRQSAWERWRDIDDSLGGDQSDSDAVSKATAVAAANLIAMRTRERRRSVTVTVPNVVGLDWIRAGDVLDEKGLVAISGEPDATVLPDMHGWIITDQSPESGAWVDRGSTVRLWLSGDGGAGVREPRRPRPTPRSAHDMRPEPSNKATG